MLLFYSGVLKNSFYVAKFFQALFIIYKAFFQIFIVGISLSAQVKLKIPLIKYVYMCN